MQYFRVLFYQCMYEPLTRPLGNGVFIVTLLCASRLTMPANIFVPPSESIVPNEDEAYVLRSK